jgi:hypothetical protein
MTAIKPSEVFTRAARILAARKSSRAVPGDEGGEAKGGGEAEARAEFAVEGAGAEVER